MGRESPGLKVRFTRAAHLELARGHVPLDVDALVRARQELQRPARVHDTDALVSAPQPLAHKGQHDVVSLLRASVQCADVIPPLHSEAGYAEFAGAIHGLRLRISGTSAGLLA